MISAPISKKPADPPHRKDHRATLVSRADTNVTNLNRLGRGLTGPTRCDRKVLVVPQVSADVEFRADEGFGIPITLTPALVIT